VNDIRVIHGDSVESMRSMPEASIDAIVTDPPYGLGFMGKAWDDLPPGEEWARECLRVLKPGGHLLAFGGSRTWHRLAVAVEDAGFEIRDSIAWLYGSGFPKSLDVSKAIDKAAGAEREVIGDKFDRPGYHLRGQVSGTGAFGRGISENTPETRLAAATITAPATPEAEQWQGWGTALKPAFEPIIVGRKPLAGTVAANVLTHGTGALNIGGSRTGTESFTAHGGGATGDHRIYHGDRKNGQGIPALERGANPRVGRWPTNVVLDDSQAAEIGDPAKFFPTFRYESKAPKRERPVVDGVAHPTVKPLGLMRWLVRLVTPPGGVVLDPFAGSGTTLEAAKLEGFAAVGIEREAEYLPLIEQRIARAS
jgi:hypothetical protein